MITPVIRRGLVWWVHPWRLRDEPEESYLMLGDHGFYCPVLFEGLEGRP